MTNRSRSDGQPDSLHTDSVAPTQALIDTLIWPIALLDKAGNIIRVNRAWSAAVADELGTLGSNYIKTCGASFRDNIEALSDFETSVTEILDGRRQAYLFPNFRLSLDGSDSLTMRVRSSGVTSPAAVIILESGSTDDDSGQPQTSVTTFQGSATLGLDLDGRITSWSPMARKLFGYNSAGAVGKNVSTLLAANSPRFPDEELMSQLRDGQVGGLDLRFRDASGRFFDGRLSLTLAYENKKPSGLICEAGILSERQRAVGALRRSEERLRYALEAASDGLWDWNLLTDRVVFSPRVAEIFADSPDQEGVHTTDVGTWHSRVHPDDKAGREEALRAHMDGVTPAYEQEYRLRADSGEWKWVFVRGRVTERRGDGTPLRMIGTITDISERKWAQEALRRSEENYRSLFEYASDAVLLFDPMTGKVLGANEKAQRLFQYSPEELDRMTIFDLHPPDQVGRVEEALEDSRSQEGTLFELEGLTKTRKRIPLETNARLVQYDGRQVLQSFIRDISERRALEEQLRQSQKMETVGRLAGGIAHDFNNLLTAIQGYTTLLQSALPAGSEEREMSEEVFNAVQRASRLTMQLLTFSRREMRNPILLDINSIVREMENMLRRLIGEHVTLRTSLDSSLGHIRADHSSIEQVITNLVINGADAMPEGGTLSLKTSNLDVEKGSKRGQIEGACVLLSVRDEGHGMDPETLTQIFEPFFTTKAAGTGTGLGLATVYGIVKQSQGDISVESAADQGTTFNICFPRQPSPEPERSVSTERPVSPSGKETILVVEDEPSVLRVTRKFLEISGYEVVEAAGASAAIRATTDHAGSIDLLLTDVIMPELSGPELAKRLRLIRPALKVLYMSGYPGEFIARHGVSEAEMGYLQKPFSQEALAGKMRQVLDS